MQGLLPSAVTTDCDAALTAAIAALLPNALHMWCLWHLSRAIAAKVSAPLCLLLLADSVLFL